MSTANCSPSSLLHIIATNLVLALVIIGSALMGAAATHHASPTTVVLFADGMFVAGFLLILLVPILVLNWIAFACWFENSLLSCSPIWLLSIISPNLILIFVEVGGSLMGIATAQYVAPTAEILFDDSMFVAGFVFVMLVPVAILNWCVFACYLTAGGCFDSVCCCCC